MMKWVVAPMLAFIAMLVPPAVKADLYAAQAAQAAQAATEAQDYARAFELFRELAELGHAGAQENLAVMYVNGEGVQRDNVLGYAWATLAREGGGGEAAAGIIAQLEPHMGAAARSRVAEVEARFGKAALQERLLPKPYVPGALVGKSCGMRSAADPNTFYPMDAKRKGISGAVLVEARVAPDGRARNVRAWQSIPAGVFEEAGLRVAFSNVYVPRMENGIKVACTIRFRIVFGVRDPGSVGANPEQQKALSDARARAEAGDPRSQLTYGLMLEMGARMNGENDRPADWFVKAAQGGVPTAQFLLGRQLLGAAAVGLETDDSKGLAWLQLAADAGQAEAQTTLANHLLLRDGGEAAAKAQDLLEKSAVSNHRDGKFFLAALLATGPDAARRDPRRALDLLDQVKGELDSDPLFFEARAAAHAMLGDFIEAQKDQKTALQKAKKLGWDGEDLQERMASYTASKPWTGNLFDF